MAKYGLERTFNQMSINGWYEPKAAICRPATVAVNGPLLPFGKGADAAMQNPKAVIRARCREKRQLEGRYADKADIGLTASLGYRFRIGTRRS